MTGDARAAAAPQTPGSPGTWQHTLVSVVRMEIDMGNLVRISLPGASRPIVVEDATYSGNFVVIGDGLNRYYVGSMDQVVVVACPMPTGPEIGMDVDGPGASVRRP